MPKHKQASKQASKAGRQGSKQANSQTVSESVSQSNNQTNNNTDNQTNTKHRVVGVVGLLSLRSLRFPLNFGCRFQSTRPLPAVQAVSLGIQSDHWASEFLSHSPWRFFAALRCPTWCRFDSIRPSQQNSPPRSVVERN